MARQVGDVAKINPLTSLMMSFSFNVATFGSFVITSSLLRGTLTELTDNGRVWMNRRVAPAARGVAVATF